MKLSLFLLGLCAIAGGKAALAAEAFPEKVEYVRGATAPEFPKNIEKVLRGWSLTALPGRNSFFPQNAIDLMSRVFLPSRAASKKDREKLVLAMHGLETSGVEYGVVYEQPKGFVLHLQESKGVVALYFEGFSAHEMEQLARELRGKVSFGTPGLPTLAGLGELLEPEAFADPAPRLAACGGPIAKDPASSTMVQKVWGCTKGVGAGAWDATGGTIVTLVKAGKAVGEGAKFVVTNSPSKTFEKAAAAMHEVETVVQDLPSIFGDVRTAYEELPSEVKVKLACELVGDIGTSALITYFTVGGGSPMLLKAVAAALGKIATALPAGSAAAAKVLALSAKIGAKATSVAETQKLVAGGAQGKAYISKLEQFDKANAEMLRTRNLGVKTMEEVADYAHYQASPADTARITYEALKAQNPALMASVEADYYARVTKAMMDGANDEAAFKVPMDAAKKAEIFREITASGKLTAAQKAAATAYVGLAGCGAAGSGISTLTSGFSGGEHAPEAPPTPAQRGDDSPISFPAP